MPTPLVELEIPSNVHDWDDADEVCRVWIGNGESAVTLRDVFGDNHDAWGMVLADIAAHVANAARLSSNCSTADVLNAIERGYRGRLAATLNITGRILATPN